MDDVVFTLGVSASFMAGAFAMLLMLAPTITKYKRDLDEAWGVINKYRARVFTEECKSKEELWRN